MHRAAVLTRALLAAALLSACSSTEPAWPCVKGASEGDTLGATVLGLYDENTTFDYDPATFFGPDVGPDEGAAIVESCIPTDLVLGETLTVDVVPLLRGDDGLCGNYVLSLQDTQLMQTGVPVWSQSWAMGGRPFGVAEHGSAIVNGCERSWNGYFLVREGANLTDPALADEVPPALLLRGIGPTPEGCATSEPANRCLYVIQLSKL